jgi:hypothetical protein
MNKQIQYQEPIVHLVVRFSDRVLRVEDTISEHAKILTERGAVWFGKLGKPVGKPNLQKMSHQIARGTPTYLYLVQKTASSYGVYRGTIVEVKTECPTEEKPLIPSYYFHSLDIDQVRFWAKLIELTAVGKDDLVKLRSISSTDPITVTLQSSMAGFFVVRETRRFFSDDR